MRAALLLLLLAAPCAPSSVGAAALSDQWGILLAIPVLQIAASIGLERHTTADHP